MSRAIAKTYNLARDYRMQITTALLAASLAMILIYVYNVYSIVSNTVSMRALDNQMTEVATAVQELDAEYLGIAGKITPDIIEAHGFAQAEVTEYISIPAGISRISPSSVGSGGDGYEL